MTEPVASGWPLGIFAMMAVMTAIIAGSTGIRLLFIDGEYRRIIDSMIKDYKALQDGDENSSAGASARRRAGWQRRISHEAALSDVRGKREHNRRGVSIDGFCIAIILGVGFVTALGLSPSLPTSVAVSAIFFLSTMIPFYYHAQNVLKKSD